MIFLLSLDFVDWLLIDFIVAIPLGVLIGKLLHDTKEGDDLSLIESETCVGECQHHQDMKTVKYETSRIDVIAQNGNDGQHYDMVQAPRALMLELRKRCVDDKMRAEITDCL